MIVVGVTTGPTSTRARSPGSRSASSSASGVALLAVRAREVAERPPPGTAVAEPGWIRKLDGIGAGRAFVFGAFWINGFLVVPAALEISRADVTGGQKAVALLFYALGATAGLIALIAYRLARPTGRRPPRRLRGWLAHEQHRDDRGPARGASAPGCWSRRSSRSSGCDAARPPGMARSFVAEARRRVGPKGRASAPIIERLRVEHADAGIALSFRSDIELLVSVMLSAQTTDVNVNRVTATLFEKYRRPEDYLAVPPEELERDIYATGFFRQKAKAIRGTMGC